MHPILLAALAAVAYLIAYHTYGRWLARKIFRLSADRLTPAQEFRDDRDFVPTSRGIVFGHHFTSIAGTGPIVGPALAIMWGWLPALLWVVFGSILIGAVHDFGALVLSLRNKGMTVGEIAGRLLSPRARLLFLTLLLFALWIVLAIFGWVIASVFVQFPEAILPVFLQIPIAIWIGLALHRKGKNLFVPSVVALGAMLLTVWLGAGGPGLDTGGSFAIMVQQLNAWLAGFPVWAWVAVLLIYCYIASTLPVWVLLQPRDYINSLQLILSLGLVCCGIVVVTIFGFTPPGAASDVSEPLFMAAPAFQPGPLNAPPIFPFLFVTIACGAISGFHCLVSSGTSSKQLRSEKDAQFVGYGSMLLEGFLATIVILAVGAGIGMGWSQAFPGVSGTELWNQLYSDWAGVTGGAAISAFVVGAANFIQALGVNALMAQALMGVLVASFAGTTLDTATRLQRYVIQELSRAILQKSTPPHGAPASPAASKPSALQKSNPIYWLQTTHGATLFAVGTAFVLAIFPAPGRPWSWDTIGTGGLILWPLFGATNQLLAGLALLVLTFWLLRRGLPVWFSAIPMVFMLIVPCWALWIDIQRWQAGASWLLVAIAVLMLAITAWMLLEAILLWKKVRGIEKEVPDISSPHQNSQR